MNKNNLPLIEFNPKLPKLSKNESKVLRLLVEAGKLIVPIYLEQEKQAQTGISKQEIEKAGQKDPAFLSPYTIVEKVAGKLVATPYHVKYANLLKPIAEKLEEAVSITDNKEFGKALKIQAKALMDGSYETSTTAWLKTEPYVLDMSIGPLHHYDGMLPLAKASYHAWVGVVEQEGTDRLNNYKSVTLSARRKAVILKERIEPDPEKIKAKVLDVLIFVGIMAKTKFVGLNLPLDVDIVQKYGAQVTLFNQPNDLRLEEQILPAFNEIFSKEFKEEFSREDLRRGYLRSVALHELAHSYLYYRNAVSRLDNLFHIIYELAATILGLRLAGTLLLKDRINNKQLESMIVAFTARSFYLTEDIKVGRFMSNYAIGGIVFINYMLESGSLRKLNGQVTINFNKVFVSLYDLSHILEDLLAYGTRKDAESFIKQYTR